MTEQEAKEARDTNEFLICLLTRCEIKTHSDEDAKLIAAWIRNHLTPESEIPCKKCGQIDHGQRGEYPCLVCGLPTTWDTE